jgi:hypothetical protein
MNPEAAASLRPRYIEPRRMAQSPLSPMSHELFVA